MKNSRDKIKEYIEMYSGLNISVNVDKLLDTDCDQLLQDIEDMLDTQWIYETETV